MGNLLTNFKKDDAAAERYYARAVEADPQSATAHANYGTLLFKRGENLKALGELRRSVQLDSRQSVARYMLAQCYAAMDDWHSAWMVSDEALRIGKIGFEDADNFHRVREGLLRLRAPAVSRGGATPPQRGDKAMEQALRQRDFDQRHAKNDPAVTMMMAMYMLDAIKKLSALTADKVKAIANDVPFKVLERKWGYGDCSQISIEHNCSQITNTSEVDLFDDIPDDGLLQNSQTPTSESNNVGESVGIDQIIDAAVEQGDEYEQSITETADADLSIPGGVEVKTQRMQSEFAAEAEQLEIPQFMVQESSSRRPKLCAECGCLVLFRTWKAARRV